VAIRYTADVCSLMSRKESEVYRQLQSHHHPNVCKLLQMKKVGDTACFVFEHALMDLCQFRQLGYLTRMLIPTCCVQIARGIAAMHRHYIFHGDITPNSILLSLTVNGPVFQILYFGLPSVVSADHASKQQKVLCLH